MATGLIRDRGEVIGTRITVYNLVPFFLDPEATEEQICRSYGLTAEQVAAARAYVLNNPGTVLARHFEIEARNEAGNPPEVVEKAIRMHSRLLTFKEWLDARERAKSQVHGAAHTGFPTFREWLAAKESGAAAGP